jgi:hypothetical protein
MRAATGVVSSGSANTSEPWHLVDTERFLSVHRDKRHEVGEDLCRMLETGKILYFRTTPFSLSGADTDVLLRQRLAQCRGHKNIAYRPLQDRVTGFDARHADAGRLHEVLRKFSQNAVNYVTALLPGYASSWRLDYASFRPLEEKGRPLRLHARNDLIHVDSFPKRPTHGDRILRIFTNINPSAERHWVTGEPLDVLAAKMGADFTRHFLRPQSTLRQRAASLLPFSKRNVTPYDQAMRRIHQSMKENSEFQNTCRKHHSHFPPGSAWLVFTDSVPHAVVSGQYALEQTMIVPRSAMRLPEKSPAAVLERLTAVPVAKAA